MENRRLFIVISAMAAAIIPDWRMTWKGTSAMIITCNALMLAGVVSGAVSGPTVFWASSPVAPAETVVLAGSGLAGTKQVVWTSVPDGNAGEPVMTRPDILLKRDRIVAPAQVSEISVKFILPGAKQPGLYAVQLISEAGQSEVVLLNRPDLRWVQGDAGPQSTAGGWVRGFGSCLAVPRKESTLILRGPRTVRLKVSGDRYAVRAAIPEDLPPGDYQVFAHNGCGGKLGWSDGRHLRILSKSVLWPQRLYDVREYGASGDGKADDSGAVGKALDVIRNAGGGVLFFPRGTYKLTRSIELPRFATLRGEGTDLTCLNWPDMPTPLPVLVHGANSFSIENITLYCANHVDIIAADTGDRPEAGNVSLHKVRVRADLFRREPAPAGVWSKEDAAKRFEAMPYYGPDTVKLGGGNVQISDCDFYGSGNALLLSRARGALVARNKFTNGRKGFCSMSGSDGVIFEENVVQGGDLMSHGSGINCLDGSVFSRNVYYARNTIRDIWGDDREAMTTDGPRGAYVGHIAEVRETVLTLAGEPRWENRSWAGAVVFLLSGRGTGQYRRIDSQKGKQVTLDQPFAVAPDSTTLAAITPLQENYLVLENEMSDAGIAVQLFGISINDIVANNRSLRAGGMRAWALNYEGGVQPSWYNQFFGNEISGATPWADSHLAVISSSQAEYKGPLARFVILRNNALDNNSRIEVQGPASDILIENNQVLRSDVGIAISNEILLAGDEFRDATGAATGIMIRKNRFTGVKHPLVGNGLDKAFVIR
jgi:Pectate lyase superfamily protein